MNIESFEGVVFLCVMLVRGKNIAVKWYFLFCTEKRKCKIFSYKMFLFTVVAKAKIFIIEVIDIGNCDEC